MNEAGVIDARLPAPAAEVTVYRRLGDVPFFILLFVAALLSAAVSRRAEAGNR